MTLREAYIIIKTPDGHNEVNRKQAMVVLWEALQTLAPKVLKGHSKTDDFVQEALIKIVEARTKMTHPEVDAQVWAYMKKTLISLRNGESAKRKREVSFEEERGKETTVEGLVLEEIILKESSAILKGETDPEKAFVLLVKELSDVVAPKANTRTDAIQNCQTALQQMHALYDESTTFDHLAAQFSVSDAEDDLKRARDRIKTNHSRARMRLLEWLESDVTYNHFDRQLLKMTVNALRTRAESSS